MAIYGLTHGVHVFMEKPPVISREQLAELEKAAAGTDRRLGFCFQNRYNPSVIKVKELLASGEAGKIRGARGIVTWSRGKEYYTESGWRGTLATEGGGAFESFCRSVGMPSNLRELGLGDITEAQMHEMAVKCTQNDTLKIGGLVRLYAADIEKIYAAAK